MRYRWRLGIGFILVLAMGCASADRQYRKAVESRDENKIRKFIHGHPESPLIMDAVAVLDTVKYETAIADTGMASLQAFLNRYPTNPLAPQASQELARRMREEEMRQLRLRLGEAEEPDLLVALADKHSERGEYDAADSLYHEALLLEPNNSSAHTGLGLVYLERGQTTEADEEIDLALSLTPEDPRVQFAAGEYYRRIGRPDLAINAFQKVLNSDINNVEAHLRLGIIYLDAGRNKNAVWEFRRVCELDADNVPALYYLGVAYADQGDGSAALRYLERYLRAPHTAEDVDNIDKARILVEQLKGDGAGHVEGGAGAVIADPNNPKPQPKPAAKPPSGRGRRPVGIDRHGRILGGVSARRSKG